MPASGCVSKCSARVASRSAIWRLSSPMMAAAALVVAANAAVTGVAVSSCSVRSEVAISRALVSIPRWWPPRLRAARVAGKVRRASCWGVGARPQHR
jgi:hypothetical protein